MPRAARRACACARVATCVASSSCFGSTPKSTRAASSQSSIAELSIGDVDVALRELWPTRGRARARARDPRRPRARRRRRARLRRCRSVNERPRVSSSRRKRSPPSTTMFIRPSSSSSSTLGDRARASRSRAPRRRRSRARARTRRRSSRHSCDQLLVARLEDVERDPLGRDEHDRQREEAELGHAGRVRASAGLLPREVAQSAQTSHTRALFRVRLAVGRRPGTPRPANPAMSCRRPVAAVGSAGCRATLHPGPTRSSGRA